MKSNFSFINKKFIKIFNFIKTAEKVLSWGDASTAIANCGKSAELGVKFFAEIEGVDTYRRDYYDIIRDKKLDIPNDLYLYLDGMRKMRNKALHTDQLFSLEEGITNLKITHIIFRYVYENYIPYHEQNEIEDFNEEYYSFLSEENKDEEEKENIVTTSLELSSEEAIEELKIISKNKKNEELSKFRTDIINEKERKNLSIWSEDEELSKALEKGNEEWRIFLHPKQKSLIKRSYSGPTLIEGGPGTGKSIVGIYRSLELSKTIYPAEQGKKILFLTFLKNLVNTLDMDMERAYKNEGVEKNVEIKGIDSFLLEVARRIKPKFKMSYALDWDIKNVNSKKIVGNRFLSYEYEEVILKRNIKTIEKYKENNILLDRDPLPQELLTDVWKLLIDLKESRSSKMNSQELCYFLLEKLEGKEILPIYDSIIVDETQDLTSIQIEVLKRMVKTKRNNLFLLSDPYQKIYNLGNFDENLSFSFGNRKEMLSINYRTTEQIKSYADKVFNDENSIKPEYILENLLKGREVGRTLVSDTQVNTKLIEKIKSLSNKYRLEEIGVLVPTSKEIKSLLSASKRLKLELNEIKETGYIQEDSINISTYAGSKGLEFKAIVVLDKEIYIEPGPYQKLEERKFQSQKYVAYTRGREVLEVIKSSKKGEAVC